MKDIQAKGRDEVRDQKMKWKMYNLKNRKKYQFQGTTHFINKLDIKNKKKSMTFFLKKNLITTLLTIVFFLYFLWFWKISSEIL